MEFGSKNWSLVVKIEMISCSGTVKEKLAVLFTAKMKMQIKVWDFYWF